jgi:hypothetical protein
MRHRTSFHSHLSETLEYRESQPIPPGRLEELVARLRAGDRGLAGEIIKGHLRPVAGIVAERARSRRTVDDALGAALLALVQAVHDAPERLYDDNITFYITTSVKYAIRDELARAHVVRVPGRTVRHKLAHGEAYEEIVPSSDAAVLNDEPEHPGDPDALVRSQPGLYKLPYVVPMARPLTPSPEFSEALRRACETPMDQAIVKLRSEGYGIEEVGQKVGYSKSPVGRMLQKIEERFDAYFHAV